MKKLTFFLWIVFGGFFGFAQKATVFLSENFSGSFPPAGWTIDNLSSQWSLSQTSKSGGEMPEARLKYISGTYTTRFISPETDLTGLSTVIFSFKHFLDDYSHSGYSIGVATRSGGGSWNTVWSLTPPGDMGPETKEVIISNSDVGASDFQVALFLDGNFYNFNYWYIDDVQLFVPDNNDDLVYSINNNPYLGNGSVDISCTIKNLGLTNLTSTDINYQIDNGTIITENIAGLNLATGETLDYTFSTQWNATPGDRNLKVWISNINGNGADDNSENDTLKTIIHVATQTVARTPLYEEFTSSTCSPCANFNSNVFTSTYLENNAGNFTLIKYQMSWPSPGDPYYTAEGGVRRAYYGVSGVPTLFIDANEGTHSNTSQLQADLDNELAKPAFFDITATHQISGNTVSVQTDILPYLSVSDFTVQVAVVEKITTGNVGSNGETEFHNVMMKMLPDASGTNKNFTANNHSYLSYTYDMSSTNVEEMNDLEVIVFIQNDKTKEVFQTAVSTEASLPSPAVSFFPENGSVNIDVNTNIEISFNQYMRLVDNSEITNSNISNFISLTDPSKANIPFTASVNDSKSVITLTPDTYLPEMTNVTVTINDASIENINDIALPGTSATFTTMLYPEASVSFNPSDGATSVDFNTDITLTFDDAMRKIDDSEITDGDISSFVTLTDPSKGNIAYTGTINTEKTVVTLNPDNYLPELTNITVTIADNFIENKYNKSLSGKAAVFTTKAFPSSSAALTPENGETNVFIDEHIKISFTSKMLLADGGEITDDNISNFVHISDPSKGDLTYTATINSEKTFIDINPDNNFSPNTDISVTIDDSAVKNEYDKLLSGSSVTFTTGTETGINTINNSIKISPNPANDFIKILGINNADIIISDISGKQLINQHITSENEQINIQNLNSGVYFIKVVSNGNSFTKKLLKK